jgi:uncharacterized protein (DUF1330 family)
MAAYLIAQVTIDDPQVYRGYTARSPDIIAKHGGRFLARGGATEVLEGSADKRRLVIVEFPSMEAARAFYNSDEYQQAKAIRTPASTAQFIIVQGID